MSKNTAPRVSDDQLLPHHSAPCPPWCDGCAGYLNGNWSDYPGYSYRPHSRAVWAATHQSQFNESRTTTDFAVSVVSDERYAVNWQTRLVEHASTKPAVSLVVTQDTTTASGDLHTDDVACDMTVELARVLVEKLQRAIREAEAAAEGALLASLRG